MDRGKFASIALTPTGHPPPLRASERDRARWHAGGNHVVAAIFATTLEAGAGRASACLGELLLCAAGLLEQKTDHRVESLEEVVDFYSKGAQPNPYLDREIQPLSLTDQEKSDLVAFLRSLSGTARQATQNDPK